MSNLKTLKTITLKSIGLDIPIGGGDFLDKTVALISGVANGYHLKSTQYGESVALQGDFVVVNAITGEVFEGSTLYAPSDYAEMISKKLDNSENGAVVELKNVEIVVSHSEKAARKYTFICRSLHTVETVNKKKELASLMLQQLKALPAPEKASK